jgi:hypothetical protein
MIRKQQINGGKDKIIGISNKINRETTKITLNKKGNKILPYQSSNYD